MDLNFIEEEIPKITRAGGSGREAEPWETHIAPLKESDKAGKSFRVWTYGKRASAVSRMTSVRERLTKAVPAENWTLAVRLVPGSDSVTNEDGTTGQYGVYVTYAGQFTDEQVAENAKKHAERSARVKAARAKAAENGAPDVQAESEAPAEAPIEGEPTAKERVAAARAKAGK